MKRYLRHFAHGQKGFTLIELLVVVAILGVLAAVIVPQVGKFIGTGTEEAANTEAHDVQTAVIAYMADNNLGTIGGSTTGMDVGPNADIGGDPAATSDPPTTVWSFLVNHKGLQAVYTMNPDGSIASALATAVPGSKWGNMVYDTNLGWHKPTSPTP